MTKQKNPGESPKIGRPTLYTEKLAQEICNTIAASHKGIGDLCKENDHWPAKANIFIWLRKYKFFRDLYAKAKEDQVEVSVDYMQEIVNESHTYIDPQSGEKRVDVPMLRVKVDAIKWQAGKLKPQKYGDSKMQEPVNTELDDECKRRYGEMDAKNRKEY